jgi:aminoglycoside 6'-N-acetyltransferase
MPPAVVTLRRMTRGDFALLARWLATPHVARWWAHEVTPQALEADFGAEVDGGEPTDLFIGESGGTPIGLVQRYRAAAYPSYVLEMEQAGIAVPPHAFSIDYFIGEADRLRQGYGSAMIRACVDATWRDWTDVTSALVCVHADNPASGRVLQRAGFACIGDALLEPDNPVDDRRHRVFRLERVAQRAPQ